MDPAGDAGTGSCHRQCTGGVPFSRKGRSAIAGLDEMTAKLQLLFSLLFTLSFVVAGLLS